MMPPNRELVELRLKRFLGDGFEADSPDDSPCFWTGFPLTAKNFMDECGTRPPSIGSLET